MKIKSKRKESSKLTDEKLIGYLVFIIVFLYYISAIFDLSVTMTVFHYSKDLFLIYEGNSFFRDWLGNNNHFYTSPSVIIDFLTPLIYIISYSSYKKKKTKINFSFFLILTIVLNVVSGAHVIGGVSWLM